MPTQTPTTLADTISSLVPFLKPLATAVTTSAQATPETVQRVQTALAGVTDGIGALAASETAVASKPILDRISADAQAVLNVAAMMPLPPPANIILMVAATLLPAVFSGVNLLLAHRVTVPAGATP